MGKYGYNLPAKAMLYNPDNDKIEPESRGGKKPVIADYNVLRQGAAGTLELTTKMRKNDYLKEDAFLNAEEDRMGKAAKEEERKRKLEELKKQDEDAAKIQK